jgi:uncharacterized SAM-dependent methyltransferase
METLVDASVSLDASRDTYMDELRRAVRWGERVPAKFQFAHADGGHYWLRLCRSLNYSYYQTAKKQLSRNSSRLAEMVHQALGSAAVDLVSLGCGDGSKDAIMLRALASELTAREQLYYYPIDISDILLVEALRYVSRQGIDRSRFRCKAMLGDFTNLQAFGTVIDRRPNRNLFSLLGNTIGSFEEAEILASLSGAMLPGDLVLIEANIGEPAKSMEMLADDTAAQWDLSTLAALEIPPESCELKSEIVGDVSIVPGTRTLVSYAVSSAENKETRYTLSAAHHYELKELQRSIGNELKVVWIDESISDEVCLLLGQRRRTA